MEWKKIIFNYLIYRSFANIAFMNFFSTVGIIRFTRKWVIGSGGKFSISASETNWVSQFVYFTFGAVLDMCWTLHTLFLSLVGHKVVEASDTTDHRRGPLTDVAISDIHLTVCFTHNIVTGFLVLAHKFAVSTKKADLVPELCGATQAISNWAFTVSPIISHGMGGLNTGFADQDILTALAQNTVLNWAA